MSLVQFYLQVLVNFLGGLITVDFNVVCQLLKDLYHWDGFIVVCFQSKFNCIGIVVNSSTCFCPIENSFCHDFVRAFKKDKPLDNNLILHNFFKLLPIFLIPGEAINKIPPDPIVSNSFSNESNNKIGRYKFTFFHDILDQLSIGSSKIPLISKQFSYGQMLEFVISHQVVALGALARARAAQHEENVGFGQCALRFEVLCYGVCTWDEDAQPIISFIFI